MVLVTAGIAGGVRTGSSLGVFLVAAGAALASAFSARVAVRALRQAPPGPAAARLYAAIATNRRAKEWGLQPDELLGLPFSVKEECLILLGAFAVAVDRNDPSTAATLIERGLSGRVPLHGWAGRELWLQGAMFASLVQGDRELARRRLTRALELEAAKRSGYANLAEAAVVLAEGQADSARALLADWLTLAKDPAVAAHLEVGNHWALELLHERLRSEIV
jgi:hypothetical protein